MGESHHVEAHRMIKVRVLEREINAGDCTVEIVQNKIGKIECVVPVDDFLDEYETGYAVRVAMRLQAIQVYSDAVLLASGIITEAMPASYGSIAIKAEDEFGRLGKIWSDPGAHYQGALLTDALSDLLTLPELPYGWELGDTSTMIDPDVTAVVNARSKEKLWPQILEIVESVPQTYVRFGGVNSTNGRLRLDVGFFGEQPNGVYAYEDENIYGTPKIKRTPVEPIKKLRPKGGKAGSRIIKLKGTETETPGFPILQDAVSGEYYVENSALSVGVSVAKTYSEIRTSNEEPPTTEEINEARQALYNQTVRELTVSGEQEVVNLDVVLSSVPAIGSMIYIRSKAMAQIYDTLTRARRYAAIEHVEGWFRITKVTFDFAKTAGAATVYNRWLQSATDAILVSLECTTGEAVADYDPLQYLADKLQNQDEDEGYGAGIGLGGSFLVSVRHSSVASDCVKGATDGKLFTFPLDPEPSEVVTRVEYRILSASGISKNSVVQEPDTNNPLILCATSQGDTAWDTLSDVTITVEYTYYT